MVARGAFAACAACCSSVGGRVLGPLGLTTAGRTFSSLGGFLSSILGSGARSIGVLIACFASAVGVLALVFFGSGALLHPADEIKQAIMSKVANSLI